MEDAKPRRSENAFVKQIFDKDTGKSLVCHLHQEEETWQTFSIGWWDGESVGYDYVMEEVVNALRREKQSALRIRELLNSRVAAAEKAHRMQALTAQARALFDEMTEIESPDLQNYQEMEKGGITEEEFSRRHREILERLSEKETGLSGIVEQMNELNLVFSKKNPWIKVYSQIEVPDTLTKAQVKKWIDRVLVKDLKTIEIVLPAAYARWKEQLPARWQEEKK